MDYWKMTFTVIGFILLGADKYVTDITQPLLDLGVGTPYIEIVKSAIGQAYDTVAAVGLAILGISSLPPRQPKVVVTDG